jgi:hypothetical protein
MAGLTMVLLISSDSDDIDATGHCRGWVIRPELAEAFADGMAGVAGKPTIESLAKVSDMVADSRRNADRIIFAPGDASA